MTLMSNIGHLRKRGAASRGSHDRLAVDHCKPRRALLETLEPRLVLDGISPTVSIDAVMPELRDAPLDEIVIRFSDPVTGFDLSDLSLFHEVENISLDQVAELTSSDGGQTYKLGNLASLTATDGEYRLVLDAVFSGIEDLQGDPLSTEGFDGAEFGPNLVTNGSFDTAGGGSNDLSGWSTPNDGVIWEEEGPGDGVARVNSLFCSDVFCPPGSFGAVAAKIRQGLATTPLTTYQLEFDIVTRRVIEEISSTNVELNVFKGDPSGSLLFSETYSMSQNGHQVLEFATEPDDLGITLQFIARKTFRDFTIDNVSVRQLIRGPSVEWTMDAAVTPLPADLNGNGFVDFEDLTILLANWNQNVSVAEGNLVDEANTPVNFKDLTALLAAWTGPGPAGLPQAAVARDDFIPTDFVDFEDLTILLSNWNQFVSEAEGNLVDPANTPVNFDDLAVLLADWTGPGPAASPQAAVARDRVHAVRQARMTPVTMSEDRTNRVTTSARDTLFDRLGRREPRRDTSSLRRDDQTSRSASRTNDLRRLQAAAVDRAIAVDSAQQSAERDMLRGSVRQAV